MNKEEREKRIADLMKYSHMSLDQAEFAVAIEAGDIPGDVIEVDPKERLDD